MPDPLPDTPSPVCWNCDREADAATSLTVRTPDGGAATFALCRECSDAAAALGAIGEDAGIAITREGGRSGPA